MPQIGAARNGKNDIGAEKPWRKAGARGLGTISQAIAAARNVLGFSRGSCSFTTGRAEILLTTLCELTLRVKIVPLAVVRQGRQ